MYNPRVASGSPSFKAYENSMDWGNKHVTKHKAPAQKPLTNIGSSGCSFTLPRQVATRDWATVEKQPKMAIAKSMICFTMVCAASETGPRAAAKLTLKPSIGTVLAE